ncbi:hypothetical protein RI367_000381 [Sorochytrium milnesiophthora]
MKHLHYLLCVGDFFAPDANDECQALLRGDIQLPVTTYFVAGRTAFPDLVAEKLRASNDNEVCPNLFYLGRDGVCKLKDDFTVAFLGGHYNSEAFATLSPDMLDDPASHHYCANDAVQRLLKFKHHLGRPGVDVLLSYDYPADVHRNDPKNETLPDNVSTSPELARVVQHLQPRYHFASGGQNAYFQRTPFETGGQALATRFFGLGGFTGEAKVDKTRKNLYAFFVTPLLQLPEAQRRANTTAADTTPSPFAPQLSGNKRALDNAEGGRPNKRQQQHADRLTCPHCGASVAEHTPYNCPHQKPADPDYKCRICGSADHYIRFCPEKKSHSEQHQHQHQHQQQKPCWFCLNSPELLRHLIVSIGEEIYVTLARGPLSEHHMLLASVEHYPTFYQLPEENESVILSELGKYKQTINAYFAAHNLVPVYFELSRAAKFNHCHVQCIGVPADNAGSILDTVKAMFDKYEHKWVQLSADETPNGDKDFFRIVLPDGSALVHQLGQSDKRMSFQFGRQKNRSREVLAQILDVPERVNWKDCVDDELETTYALKLKQAFTATGEQ